MFPGRLGCCRLPAAAPFIEIPPLRSVGEGVKGIRCLKEGSGVSAWPVRVKLKRLATEQCPYGPLVVGAARTEDGVWVSFRRACL